MREQKNVGIDYNQAGLIILAIIIQQYPVRFTVQIIILSGFKAPNKRRKPNRTKQQSNRDKINQNTHVIHLNRKEFAITNKDDPDIQIAATIGVARPAKAIGTATKLYKTANVKFCRTNFCANFATL